MKRSKVLDKLADTIINKWDLPWGEFSGDFESDLYEFCNDVLTCLEKDGVVLPTWLGPRDENGMHEIHEGWEPE